MSTVFGLSLRKSVLLRFSAVRLVLDGTPGRARSIHRGVWYKDFLEDLWSRRQLIGPDAPTARCRYPNWNTESELYAFGKRLGEDMKEETLRKIFAFGADEDSYGDLLEEGSTLLADYVKAYLRCHLPRLPEEGIVAIADFLTCDESLAHTGRHIGITDLLEMTEFPAPNESISRAFKCVVGALAVDSSLRRAEYLVQDLVLTQLVGVDLNELWVLTNPMGVLTQILAAMNCASPESRLIRSAGAETITPVYVVGIYSDKQLLGESPGETVQIAEEMAARDCLRSLWGISEDRNPFSFGENGRTLDLTYFRENSNGSLARLCQSQEDLLTKEDGRAGKQIEPLNYEQMMVQFKEKIEPEFGTTTRRRQKHKFYGGTYNKRNQREMIKPRPRNI